VAPVPRLDGKIVWFEVQYLCYILERYGTGSTVFYIEDLFLNPAVKKAIKLSLYRTDVNTLLCLQPIDSPRGVLAFPP
jgi:hypothetical protein